MVVLCPKCQTENTSDSQFYKSCAEPLPPSKDASPSLTKTVESPKEELTTDSVFTGRYQIIEKLGRGGRQKTVNGSSIISLMLDE